MTSARGGSVLDVMAEQCTGRSPRGVVLAAAPVAARIGADALSEGGNAFDAVVAAALAETVLLPPKCGLAGDLVALCWKRGADAPAALLAIGGAPRGLAGAITGGEFAPTGPNAVGVPGAPAGYAALAGRGRLSLDRLARPASRLAREGFCWSRICAIYAQESSELVSAQNEVDTSFYPGGRPLASGEVVRLPGLADALDAFAGDPDGFLTGPVGRAIVSRVEQAGGVLTRDDMAFAFADWTEPDTAGGSRRIFATPAPTHGPSLLSALATGLGTGGSGVGVYRAVMTAIDERRATLSDPGGTSMVSAIDGDGTMVVVVHSNSYPRFGSGLVVDEYDLVLANRAGRGFSSEPGHPNFPRPGIRPATTLHAWGIASDDGKRTLGATPGGANQMPWNAQAVARLLRGSGVGRAVVGPRWEWLPGDDGIRIEEGFDAGEREELESAAPRCETVHRWGLQSAMQVVTDEPGEAFVGVVDPRTVGAVVPL